MEPRPTLTDATARRNPVAMNRLEAMVNKAKIPGELESELVVQSIDYPERSLPEASVSLSVCLYVSLSLSHTQSLASALVARGLVHAGDLSSRVPTVS